MLNITRYSFVADLKICHLSFSLYQKSKSFDEFDFLEDSYACWLVRCYSLGIVCCVWTVQELQKESRALYQIRECHVRNIQPLCLGTGSSLGYLRMPPWLWR